MKKIPHDTVFTDPNLALSIRRCPEHGSGPGQHGHTFQELVVILGGHGMHSVGTETYPLEAGDVFVLLGDMTHGYPAAEHLSLINILFDTALLGVPLADIGSVPGYHALFTVEPQMRRQQPFRNRLRLTPPQLAQAERLVAETEEELEKRAHGSGFMATSLLMRLIGYLSRCYSELERDENRPITQLSELLGYLDRHYAEPVTVRDLTEVAHMSQTTLMRTFQNVMGRSPIEYLIQLRLAKAQTLLLRTDAPISAIAQQTGWRDSNYFARRFRQALGLSPRDFRKQRQRQGTAP